MTVSNKLYVYEHMLVTGVDAETLLTDGGTLALPVRRDSLRLKTSASRAFGKLKEKLSKFKVKKSSSKYKRQLDDHGGDTSTSHAMHSIVSISDEDCVFMNVCVNYRPLLVKVMSFVCSRSIHK